MLAKGLVHNSAFVPVPMFDPETFDVIVFDPPYGIGNKKLEHKDKAFKKSSEDWDTFESVDSQYDFYEKTYEMLWRVLNPTGVLVTFGSFHNIYLCGEILQRKLGARVINSIVWEKENAMFNVTRSTLIESTEHMIIAGKSKDFYFDYEKSKTFAGGKQLRNVWRSPLTKNSERIGHPHQKPIWLLSRLLDIFCPPDGRVLDPMAGSGTTAVVCEAKNLWYYCIEKNEKYYFDAKKRIEAAAREAYAERNALGI